MFSQRLVISVRLKARWLLLNLVWVAWWVIDHLLGGFISGQIRAFWRRHSMSEKSLHYLTTVGAWIAHHPVIFIAATCAIFVFALQLDVWRMQSRDRKAVGAPPNLVMLAPESRFGRITESDGFLENAGMDYAILLRFYNQPIPGKSVGPVDHIRAVITYLDPRRVEAQRVDYGCWVEALFNAVSFGVGDTRSLILAIKRESQRDFEVVEDKRGERSLPRPVRLRWIGEGQFLATVTLTTAKGDLLKTYKVAFTVQKDSVGFTCASSQEA